MTTSISFKSIVPFLFLLLGITVSAQQFTRQDTLRGSITPERAWWDVKHYDLSVQVIKSLKMIDGVNAITYEVLSESDVLQVDLQAPMTLDRVVQDNLDLEFISEGSAHFIQLQKTQKIGEENELVLYFSGYPKEAENAPWDGGFSWKRDDNNKHFIATSNQGIGASVWWPNKDHAYDEPDNGLDLFIKIAPTLSAVGNGRLVEVIDNGNSKTWHWKVENPINNYGVNINIGDYVNFSETYEGEKGTLDMDYWVLKDNLEKAKEQFKQAPMTIEAFEHWFGPYPFYEDSFKLVEVPYLGMEHQSSVTYGNKYANGYLGNDLSGTGWGLKFDFIIIHEVGHEWFANNITHIDVADMWIHEGFTAYSESLYLDYHFGTKASADYVIGTRRNIQNDKPLIGIYDVHSEGSGDMYYKGANILHTVRQLVNDDDKWREILRGLNEDFYHQTVTSKQIEDYINERVDTDLTTFWDQYLRTVNIPTFEYKFDGKKLEYRFVNTVEDFELPVVVIINDEEHWINADTNWQSKTLDTTIETVEVKRDFYVDSEEVE